MTDDLTLDRHLRALDAADRPVDRDRQAHLLDELLATAPPARTRRPGRVAWLAAAAVTVGASAVVLPLATGGEPAFASWTQEPGGASAEDAATLREACLDQVGSSLGGYGSPRVDSEDLRTRLVDRRGDWVSVLLTWTGSDRYRYDVSCFGELPAGSDDPRHLTHAVSGGGGFAAPTGDELLEGSMTEFSAGGGFLGLGASATAATTHGEVGPDVVGVTIHAGGTSVEASVEDGTYAAWWPGRFSDTGLRYDVTLRDGTVLSDVDPARGKV